MWGEWMKFVVGGDKTKTAYRKAVRARVEAVRNCPSAKTDGNVDSFII